MSNTEKIKHQERKLILVMTNLISCFQSVNHFYLPTNALNCIKLRRLKSTCINPFHITVQISQLPNTDYAHKTRQVISVKHI